MNERDSRRASSIALLQSSKSKLSLSLSLFAFGKTLLPRPFSQSPLHFPIACQFVATHCVQTYSETDGMIDRERERESLSLGRSFAFDVCVCVSFDVTGIAMSLFALEPMAFVLFSRPK